jgi:murein DD-endopeptidase MepM/ murein hydrolase activator NlpD
MSVPPGSVAGMRSAATAIVVAAVGLATVPAAPAIEAGTSPARVAPSPGPAFGTYAWPVQGPVLRGFDPPDTAYGAGHRGIDIGASFGTPVGAPADGRVAFAGPVAGGLFVSIDHPDGVRTTLSWLSLVSVGAGDVVRRGDLLGRTGQGHPGMEPPHLHFGARFGGTYIDPMLLLEHGSLVGLIHLAPLDPTEGSAAEG